VHEGDQRVEVVALERAHVAGQELGVGGVERSRVAFRPQGGQGGPGPLESAVHRRDGGLQQLGCLGCRPTQHLAEDEAGTLAGREVSERGHERQLDRLAVLGQLRRVGPQWGGAGVR
jgi:hypothetical protein